MAKISLTIDGKKITVNKGTTVLEAAKQAGIYIPTLCYYEGLPPQSECRLCIVEVEGMRGLPASCTLPAQDGMVVNTRSKRVIDARKFILQLLLCSHPADCKTCEKHGRCEFQSLLYEYGMRDYKYEMRDKRHFIDKSSPAIERDLDKCILCGRCVRVCRDIQTVGVYSFAKRGLNSVVTTAYDKPISETPCVSCGQCTIVCPTGAISERESINEVWNALHSGKHVICQIAPSVRVSIGEMFGLPPGRIVTGKTVAALRRLGFHKVFDTNFGADLTIMEEAHELAEKVEKGLPLLSSSCCPAWIDFIEHFYPDLLSYLSTCKSPMQMFGAIAKTYYAEKNSLKPEDIVLVSIMPCTAKKFEAARPEMCASGVRDVDFVLTTREAARMMMEVGIHLPSLKPEPFDEPLGISTGAAALFGATGGVTEAALRTAYEIATGKELKQLDFKQVRGFEFVRQATVDFDGRKVKVAIANTLGGARKILEELRAGNWAYDFVEVMACRGGCIGGGGQPIPPRELRLKVIKERAKAIYRVDRSLPIRKSHENPAIKKLYEEFLVKPLGEKSMKLLHTTYTPKKGYGL
ncbi:MAG: NADH-dependent [FeFe] hydrogenase, group A6 [Candidatus Micrarchaeia archaeon]